MRIINARTRQSEGDVGNPEDGETTTARTVPVFSCWNSLVFFLPQRPGAMARRLGSGNRKRGTLMQTPTKIPSTQPTSCCLSVSRNVQSHPPTYMYWMLVLWYSNWYLTYLLEKYILPTRGISPFHSLPMTCKYDYYNEIDCYLLDYRPGDLLDS